MKYRLQIRTGLELEDVLFGIAEPIKEQDKWISIRAHSTSHISHLLLEDTTHFALGLVLGFGTGDGFQHRVGTADEDLQALGLGAWNALLDKVGANVALGTRPVLGGTVQDVDNVEAVGISLGIAIKLLLEQNIFFGLVGEDKGDLGLVVTGVLVEDLADDLKHGGDTRATGDHTDVVNALLRPVVLGNGALDIKGLANLEVVNMLAHLALGVDLNDEVNVTLGL